MCAAPAGALDLHRQISQYGHSAWRVQEGFFNGAPHAVTQTADGYLWIGAEAGLTRFDGVRFAPWTPPAGKSLPSPSVISLLGARDGSLWIGTLNGLAHWKNGELTSFPGTGRVNAIAEDAAGAAWMVRSRVPQGMTGPLCRADGQALRCYDKKDGLAFDDAEALIDDRAGGLWIGAVHGVCHWKAGAAANYFPPALRTAAGLAGILALELESDGSVLVGVGQSGAGMGLERIVAGAWQEFATPDLRGSSLAVPAILRDRDGGLWVGTHKDGVYHFHAGIVDRFDQPDGLSGDSIESFFEDREGNIWAASAQGIDRFRDIAVATLGKRQGLSSDHVGSVFASPSGGVWIGNGDSLDLLRNNRVSAITKNDLPGRVVTSLLEDRAGRLWLGTDGGLNVRENGRFQPVRRRDGSALGAFLFAMTEDADGDVWGVSTRPQTLFHVRNLQVIEETELPYSLSGAALAADAQSGVWLGFATGMLARFRAGALELVSGPDDATHAFQLLVDRGAVWGATANGLVRWKDGKKTILTTRNGLPCDYILSSIRDNADALWLYAGCGVMSIPAAELEKWVAQPESSIAVKTFDALDGAQAGKSPFQPVVSKSPDGRIWFANDTVVQFVDPGRLRENPMPPPVRIEQVLADRKTYLPVENLRLPALTRNLQIDYTALSLAAPQKVKFRYKLEGRDEGWQDPDTRRQAFYSDLAPRTYRFQVIACNNSGVWNETGASWKFSVAPACYQTAWFRFLCAGGVILGLWALGHLRARQIAAGMSARFDERMAERNRLAGELHDTILQTVQATKMIADDARYDQTADAARLRETIENISDWLAQATSEARAALNALRASTMPKDDLAVAFQRAAEASGATASMRLLVSVEGAAQELHPILRDEIYRIGSEAIRNAALHSEATGLEVSLSYARDLTLRVRDNGKGIDPQVAASGKPGHFGLRGMQERAGRIHGTFHLLSRPGSGTEVVLAVPGKMVFRQTRSAAEDGRAWLRGLVDWLRLSRKGRETEAVKEEKQ